MAKTGFTVNMKYFDKKFYRIVNKTIPSLSAEGLMKGATQLIRDAILETPTVPKKTGHLRRTQQIERPKIEHREISIEAGFNADYSAAMHEAPSNLNFSEPGSGPQFLTSKLAKNKDKYMKTTANHIKSNAK